MVAEIGSGRHRALAVNKEVERDSVNAILLVHHLGLLTCETVMLTLS